MEMKRVAQHMPVAHSVEQFISLGVQSVNDVFYAEIQSDGSLHIDKTDDLVPE
jgi:hypothetical protein